MHRSINRVLHIISSIQSNGYHSALPSTALKQKAEYAEVELSSVHGFEFEIFNSFSSTKGKREGTDMLQAPSGNTTEDWEGRRRIPDIRTLSQPARLSPRGAWAVSPHRQSIRRGPLRLQQDAWHGWDSRARRGGRLVALDHGFFVGGEGEAAPFISPLPVSMHSASGMIANSTHDRMPHHLYCISSHRDRTWSGGHSSLSKAFLTTPTKMAFCEKLTLLPSLAEPFSPHWTFFPPATAQYKVKTTSMKTVSAK